MGTGIGIETEIIVPEARMIDIPRPELSEHKSFLQQKLLQG
jgi:hypothetical protein